MRYEVIDSLVYPATGLSLKVGTVDVESDGEIKEGTLVEPSTNAVIPIRNFIPRFVESDAYNACFGMEWNLFRRTQIDRFNGTTISAKRFYTVTGWSPDELRGQRFLKWAVAQVDSPKSCLMPVRRCGRLTTAVR